jgi:ABC-type uncharacterized transport system substrate-binding protein
LALAAQLPTLYVVREYVDAGGLMSYGPNWPDMWYRAADFVDKILRGAKPADLPVEQPTKFDLIINLTTAKALGITIPEPFLLRAERPRFIQRIQEAIADDTNLAENSEYQAAKTEQDRRKEDMADRW